MEQEVELDITDIEFIEELDEKIYERFSYLAQCLHLIFDRPFRSPKEELLFPIVDIRGINEKADLLYSAEKSFLREFVEMVNTRDLRLMKLYRILDRYSDVDDKYEEEIAKRSINEEEGKIHFAVFLFLARNLKVKEGKISTHNPYLNLIANRLGLSRVDREVWVNSKVKDLSSNSVKIDKDFAVSLPNTFSVNLYEDGLVRELKKKINDIRKSTKCALKEVINVEINTDDYIMNCIIDRFRKEIEESCICKIRYKFKFEDCEIYVDRN